MSFWYGLPFADIRNMPVAAIQAYNDQIPALQAEHRLALVEVITLPYVSQQDRQSMLAHWERDFAGAADPGRSAPEPAVLASIGIQVLHVSQPASPTAKVRNGKRRRTRRSGP